jgi:hypothetical protein
MFFEAMDVVAMIISPFKKDGIYRELTDDFSAVVSS